ncbi:LOW QUALITY PROTEIN: hypothetical protein BU14_0027s0107 [Porphyra umbilicalis]|uniref:GDT1 family protein n=1 Tax=Porphyra umbilicalis TaxID=2786 RepID=A0A1X6PJR5_PORUM|nr:LOW QUALITY PROTEIN: hypothetical protein BU14_0027s0107 [Porphyra umbilicalis]|eukprot:OSX81081.1 LOW QUALITY PROTEIN: hypothetical protein BU14_0027s0107 [Porphyra umbilicalis]
MSVGMIAFAAPAGAAVGARRVAALPSARRDRRSALAVAVPLRRPAVAAWCVPKATVGVPPPAAAGRPADELSAAAGAAAAVPPAVAAAAVAAGTARPFWSVPAARARASVLSVARRALRAAVTAASTVRRVRVRHGAALRLARMAPTVALAVVGMFASRSFGPLAVGKLASVAVPAVPVAGSATAAAGGGGLAKAFAEAFGVVFLSEFGDKSMFATALMAMKHSPSMVFTGALLALTAMTLIACCLGQVMHFLPPIVTHYFSVALFVVFDDHPIPLPVVDTGGDPPASGLPAVATAGSTATGVAPATPVAGGERAGAEELVASLDVQGEAESKVSVLLKIVSLIFVAEWCDRSMLATMALAASGNAVAVIGGATAANVLCTGMAVVAAVAVSSKISERMVALVSGILFEVFAVFTLIEGPESLD